MFSQPEQELKGNMQQFNILTFLYSSKRVMFKVFLWVSKQNAKCTLFIYLFSSCFIPLWGHGEGGPLIELPAHCRNLFEHFWGMVLCSMVLQQCYKGVSLATSTPLSFYSQLETKNLDVALLGELLSPVNNKK